MSCFCNEDRKKWKVQTQQVDSEEDIGMGLEVEEQEGSSNSSFNITYNYKLESNNMLWFVTAFNLDYYVHCNLSIWVMKLIRSGKLPHTSLLWIGIILAWLKYVSVWGSVT